MEQIDINGIFSEEVTFNMRLGSWEGKSQE